MYFYKKKSSMGVGKLLLWLFAAIGAAASAFAIFKFAKKHLFCRCKKNKMGTQGLDFPDFDLTLDEKNVKGGCCSVAEGDNDLRSEANAVVNSENRMLNIENGDDH